MGRKTTWIDFLGWSAVYLSDLLVILFRHLWLLCLCSDDVRTEWHHWVAASGFSLQSPVADCCHFSDTIIRHLCLCRLLPDEDATDPKTARQQWMKKKKNTWREQGAVCRRLSTCRRVFFGSTRFFFFSLLHTLAWHIWYLWNIWDLSSRFK